MATGKVPTTANSPLTAKASAEADQPIRGNK